MIHHCTSRPFQTYDVYIRITLQESSLLECFQILKVQFSHKWALSSTFALLLLKAGFISLFWLWSAKGGTWCNVHAAPFPTMKVTMTVKLWKRQKVVHIIHALFSEAFGSFIWWIDWDVHHYSLKTWPSFCLRPACFMQTEGEQIMNVFNLRWTFICCETSLLNRFY